MVYTISAEGLSSTWIHPVGLFCISAKYAQPRETHSLLCMVLQPRSIGVLVNPRCNNGLNCTHSEISQLQRLQQSLQYVLQWMGVPLDWLLERTACCFFYYRCARSAPNHLYKVEVSATKLCCPNARVLHFLDDVRSERLKGGAIEVHAAQHKHTQRSLTMQSNFHTELHISCV